jgi:DNA-directed RNA polymerase specialized sigma subunit
MNEHYVNNREFTAAVSEWKTKQWNPWKARKDKAEKAEKPFNEQSPPVTSYMAECFHKIAARYARRPNWSGYTYIDDMISEAVYLCIKYAHNFKPDKSNNAFAYFTQYAHNGFLQYINREKKFSKFKFDLVKESSAGMSKMDYNDINLYDEEAAGFDQIDKQEAEILAENHTPVESIVKEEGAIHEPKPKKPGGGGGMFGRGKKKK